MSLQASSSQVSTPSSDPTFRPPRPPNPWILFRSDRSRELAAQKIPQSQVSKIVSDNWRYASADVKNYYAAKAADAKAAHAAKYPGYRFAPQKKEAAEAKQPSGRKTSANTREARQQAAAPYTVPVRATATASPAPVMQPHPYAAMPIPVSMMHAPQPLYPDAAQAAYSMPENPFGYLGPSPSMDLYSPSSPILPPTFFGEEVEEDQSAPTRDYYEDAALESSTLSPAAETVDSSPPMDHGLAPVDETPIPFTTGGMPTDFSLGFADNTSGLYLPSPSTHQVGGGSVDAGPSSSWESSHVSPPDQGAADLDYDWMNPSQNSYNDNSQESMLQFDLGDHANLFEGMLSSTSDPSIFDIDFSHHNSDLDTSGGIDLSFADMDTVSAFAASFLANTEVQELLKNNDSPASVAEPPPSEFVADDYINYDTGKSSTSTSRVSSSTVIHLPSPPPSQESQLSQESQESRESQEPEPERSIAPAPFVPRPAAIGRRVGGNWKPPPHVLRDSDR